MTKWQAQGLKLIAPQAMYCKHDLGLLTSLPQIWQRDAAKQRLFDRFYSFWENFRQQSYRGMKSK